MFIATTFGVVAYDNDQSKSLVSRLVRRGSI